MDRKTEMIPFVVVFRPVTGQPREHAEYQQTHMNNTGHPVKMNLVFGYNWHIARVVYRFFIPREQQAGVLNPMLPKVRFPRPRR